MASNTTGSTIPNLGDQTQWLTDLMSKQQAMFGSFGAFGGTVPSGEGPAPLSGPAAQLLAPWLEAAKTFSNWQQQGIQQMTGMMPGLSKPLAEVDPRKDKRFAGEKWTSDPRFEVTAKTYLAQADALQKALDAMPVDERLKGQWGFMLRQVIDALSPANWLPTNPEAIQTALDSKGQSLVEGAKLFMQDLAKGRISMTDEKAFEVGRNVALTPGHVVFENELMQLHPVHADDAAGARAAAGDRARPASTSSTSSTCSPRTRSSATRCRRATRCSSCRGATSARSRTSSPGTTTSSAASCRPSTWRATSPAPTRSTRSASASAARC